MIKLNVKEVNITMSNQQIDKSNRQYTSFKTLIGNIELSSILDEYFESDNYVIFLEDGVLYKEDELETDDDNFHQTTIVNEVDGCIGLYYDRIYENKDSDKFISMDWVKKMEHEIEVLKKHI